MAEKREMQKKEGIHMNEEMKILEKENASMRECIESVLMRLVDYDGYKGHAPGLEGLIDGAMETLQSGYPERVVDYKGREACPLCFQVFGDKIIKLEELIRCLREEDSEKVLNFVKSAHEDIMQTDLMEVEAQYIAIEDAIKESMGD